MPSNTDLDAAIRDIVASEVERILSPYRNALAKMADMFGGAVPAVAPARRGPGRPPRNAAAPVARGGGRRRARAGNPANRGDASRFKEGQTVTYKQGRGSFEAKIVAIDANTNTVTIERAKDGKKIDRPASKVYAA